MYVQRKLRQFGAVAPYHAQPGGSWAMVGYKGNRKVDWVDQDMKGGQEGEPAKVVAKIPLEWSTIDEEDEVKVIGKMIRRSHIFSASGSISFGTLSNY